MYKCISGDLHTCRVSDINTEWLIYKLTDDERKLCRAVTLREQACLQTASTGLSSLKSNCGRIMRHSSVCVLQCSTQVHLKSHDLVGFNRFISCNTTSPDSRHFETTNHLCDLMAPRPQPSSWRVGAARSFTSVAFTYMHDPHEITASLQLSTLCSISVRKPRFDVNPYSFRASTLCTFAPYSALKKTQITFFYRVT